MKRGKSILETERFQLTLERLAHQLIENYEDFENTSIIGIQESGVILANRLDLILKDLIKKPSYQFGSLDISFYRDDFRIREKPLKVSMTSIDFMLDGQKVILVDDVLYSGRTVQAAMSAIQDYGRPERIEFLCLVDRRFNRHLPIKADYAGVSVDALDDAYVKVEWKHIDGVDRILFYNEKVETK